MQLQLSVPRRVDGGVHASDSDLWRPLWHRRRQGWLLVSGSRPFDLAGLRRPQRGYGWLAPAVSMWQQWLVPAGRSVSCSVRWCAVMRGIFLGKEHRVVVSWPLRLVIVVRSIFDSLHPVSWYLVWRKNYVVSSMAFFIQLYFDIVVLFHCRKVTNQLFCINISLLDVINVTIVTVCPIYISFV